MAIQLIPFLYMFAGLWKLGVDRIWAAAGFIATAFGTVLVFFPSSNVTEPLLFLAEVAGSFVFMLGLAILLYKIGQRKLTKARA